MRGECIAEYRVQSKRELQSGVRSSSALRPPRLKVCPGSSSGIARNRLTKCRTVVSNARCDDRG